MLITKIETNMPYVTALTGPHLIRERMLNMILGLTGQGKMKR